MDWQSVDREPLMRAMVGSLVAGDGTPPLSGLMVAGAMGGATRLLVETAAEAADHIWAYQKDNGIALWSVAQVMAKLGLPAGDGTGIVRHLVAELERRRKLWLQSERPASMADIIRRGVPQMKRAAVPGDEHVEAGYTFSRQGEMWRVAFGGQQAFLKDGLGPRYIAHLLLSPKKAIAAVDLHALVAGNVFKQRLGSAGPQVDLEARNRSTERCREIESELVEAKRHNDEGRVDLLRDELEALADYLAQSTGLRGRDRRASDDADRIRRSVFQAIRRTISSLEKHLPAAGRHLDSAVRTGRFVSYQPAEEVPWAL